MSPALFIIGLGTIGDPNGGTPPDPAQPGSSESDYSALAAVVESMRL